MRPRPAAIVGVLLALTLSVAACGEEQSSAVGVGEGDAPKSKGVEAPGVGGECRDQVGSFLAAMDSLREKLVGGLSYIDYLAEVNGIRSIHGEVPDERLSVECLMLAGTPGERALNLYIEGVNTWGDCLAVTTCGLPSIEPALQRDWARAAKLLGSAQRGMRDLDPERLD